MFVLSELISASICISELMQLTGVAAILRFPMPDLDDEEEVGGSDSD